MISKRELVLYRKWWRKLTGWKRPEPPRDYMQELEEKYPRMFKEKKTKRAIIVPRRQNVTPPKEAIIVPRAGSSSENGSETHQLTTDDLPRHPLREKEARSDLDSLDPIRKLVQRKLWEKQLEADKQIAKLRNRQEKQDFFDRVDDFFENVDKSMDRMTESFDRATERFDKRLENLDRMFDDPMDRIRNPRKRKGRKN